MRFILKKITLLILTSLAGLSLHSAEPTKTAHEIWAEVIGAANAEDHNDLLDELKALSPLEIYLDRANVAIATKRTGQTEEGYYIQLSISSYIPTNNAEWTFTRAGNDIWTYSRERDDIAPNQDPTNPTPDYSDIQTEWVVVDKAELERERAVLRKSQGPVDPFAEPPPYKWMADLFDFATIAPYDWVVDIIDGQAVTYDRTKYSQIFTWAHEAKANKAKAASPSITQVPYSLKKDNNYDLLFQDKLKLERGIIVSYAFCSSGAEVYWYSHDLTEKTLISEHNIRSFYQINGRIYGYGVLNNDYSNRGYIVEFIESSDHWSATEVYQSNEAIVAHCHLPNSGVIIATGTQIIRISNDGEYNILVSDQRWRSQIHSIVAAPDGYIYFSMDHFIGRFPLRKTLGDYELLELAKN